MTDDPTDDPTDIVQAIQGDARGDDLAVLIADTGADPAEVSSTGRSMPR